MWLKKKGKNEWYIITHRIRIILGANLCLLIFCGTYDEIALFSSLQLRNSASDSGWELLSVFMCVIMIILAFYLIGLLGYLSYSYQKIKKDAKKNKLTVR